MKKNIPKIREREGNEKIHSHNSGMGIRGFHSREWMGTGIPAHPCSLQAFGISPASKLLRPEHKVKSWREGNLLSPSESILLFVLSVKNTMGVTDCFSDSDLSLSKCHMVKIGDAHCS